MRSLCWTAVLSLWTALTISTAVGAEKCGPPPEYAHAIARLGKEESGRQEFSPGEKLNYRCADDMTPYAGKTAVHCVDGKWTKLTLKCEKKYCGYTGELPNGQWNYEGTASIGERVYATCNKGYTLKGPKYMICKASGWSEDFPICVEGEKTCSAPTVANSVSSGGSPSLYGLGDNVTFTCRPGFQLKGAQHVKCGPDGHWQPQPPQCVPSPVKTEQSSQPATGGCARPLTNINSNADLADKYITMTSFASGVKVQYTCNTGYTPVGGSRYRVCKNGKWTPMSLRCELKLCGSAGEILNGQFKYTGVEFGSTATAICNEGYILVGQKSRHCMNEGWDGRIPTCEAVVCEEPSQQTNAEWKDLHGPPYNYRSVIRYQCRVGTLVGQKEIWCTKNGTWSALPPQCKEMTCRPPGVTNGFWSRAHKKVYAYRDVILIDCDEGFTLMGPNSVSCNYNGQWTPNLPICKRTSRRQHYPRRY